MLDRTLAWVAGERAWTGLTEPEREALERLVPPHDEPPSVERSVVLVQVPAGEVPDDVEALWDHLEGWVAATVGSCSGVDFSSEMTALADVDDIDAAVEKLIAALPASGLPPGTRIAARRDDEDVIAWPEAERGNELPGLTEGG